MMLAFALLCFALLGWFLWWNRSVFHINAAHAAFRKGDEEGTLAAFAKAEAAGRVGAEVTASWVYLLLKHGRNDEAGSVIHRSLHQGRRGKPLKEAERRLLQTYQALFLRQTGRLDDAVALLEDLHAQGYKTSALYGNLGFFLIEQGNLLRAEEVCTEAAEWAPDGKVILDNLGTLYLMRENWDRAAEVYQRLLALEPTFPEAFWGAGRAARETGRLEEARQHWEKALSLPFNALTTVEKGAIEEALKAVRP